MQFPIAPLLHAGASISPFSFSVHWSTVIGIVALAALYEWAAGRLTSPGAPAQGQRPTTAQRIEYDGALVLMFFSLNGWLHDLSDTFLFSAHMLQHLMLALVVAPLMVMGTPGWMLRPALAWRGVRPVAAWLTR